MRDATGHLVQQRYLGCSSTCCNHILSPAPPSCWSTLGRWLPWCFCETSRCCARLRLPPDCRGLQEMRLFLTHTCTFPNSSDAPRARTDDGEGGNANVPTLNTHGRAPRFLVRSVSHSNCSLSLSAFLIVTVVKNEKNDRHGYGLLSLDFDSPTSLLVSLSFSLSLSLPAATASSDTSTPALRSKTSSTSLYCILLLRRP